MKYTSSLFIISFFLLLSPIILSAQNYIGVEGGGYFALRQTGLKIGLVSDFPLNEFISFHPELIYVQKGVALPLDNLSTEKVFRSPKIDYLQIPLTTHFALAMRTFSLRAFIGPYLSYGLRASAVNIENVEEQFEERFSFHAIRTRQLDFGLSIGSGLVLEVAQSNRMFLDIRYNLGLRDLNEHPDATTFNEGTSLTMGFMIAFKQNSDR